MTERETVKIISDNSDGFCLKYREDILPGDRKYYPPAVEAEPETKKRKVKHDPLS